MTKIITVFNQKGGVGKTTTVINLSAALIEKGKRVLITDMDPQGNSTSGVGISKEQDYTVYDFLLKECSYRDVVQPTEKEGLFVIPSNGDLAGIEIELAQRGNWQYLLYDGLKDVDDVDFIFIDSPPSLGILSMMSLVASDSILIPVQCEYYALEGVGQLLDTIHLVKDNFNHRLEIEGVIMTMYDGRTNLSLQVVEEVKDFFEDLVYSVMIPRNVRLAEAPSYGMDILSYDRKSKGAESYLALAEEFLEEQDK